MAVSEPEGIAVKTGPQKYPGASTAQWYQSRFGGDPMEVNVVVLHTTEGRTLPGYDGGSNAPNLTAVPDLVSKKLKWYQHFDIETSSRALQNLRGGVETNTLNVVQVELVGTCDPVTHKRWGGSGYVYWPQAPEWALRGVAEFLAWMHVNHGVPLTGPAKWPAYPTSYANGGGQRMSAAAWDAFKGVCGHMHVPENVHGDPGAIDFPALMTYSRPLPVTHTVRPGETLSSIGALTGVSWPEIAKANNLKTPYRIYPGQELKIPKK